MLQSTSTMLSGLSIFVHNVNACQTLKKFFVVHAKISGCAQLEYYDSEKKFNLGGLLALSWATRLTVVSLSSESACSFSDITLFSTVRPSRLKMKSTPSHSSLVLVFFSCLPR